MVYVGPKRDRQLRAEEDYRKQMELIKQCPNLPCAWMISKKIYHAVFRENLLELLEDFDKISLDNYCEPLRVLVKAEHARSEMALRRYDGSRRVSLVKVGDHRAMERKSLLNETEIKNISKSDPSLVPGDLVVATQSNVRHVCIITQIKTDALIFGKKMTNGLFEPIEEGQYEIRLATSGLLLERTLMSIVEFSGNYLALNSIFNSPGSRQSRISCSSNDLMSLSRSSKPELNERFDKLNEPQQRAITNILDSNNRSRPYILFGPPGTGKTRTIVELVTQIYHGSDHVKILVVAGSNTCVDKLASDLHATGQLDSMIRLSATTHIGNLIKANAPFKFMSSAKFSIEYRVCVTTNFLSGFVEPIYDWIIIDEAGHSTEPDSLIAINKLIGSTKHVVLAGDPKQLGPVVKCRQAAELGLEKSLLVRLTSEVSDYKLGSDKKYNEKYITRLDISYRCDPRLMSPWNELYYEGNLKGLGKTPPSLLRLLQVRKPNLVRFVNEGQEQQLGGSTSYYNELEAANCAEIILQLYLMGLEPHQIGLITPYKSQVGEIHKALEDTLVGSMEMLLNDRFKIPQPPQESQKHLCSVTSESKKDDLNEITTRLDDLDLKEDTSSSSESSSRSESRDSKLAQSQEKPIDKSDWMSVKVDTVDGFQGNEREIILVSLVRTTSESSQLRFVDDDRRFNVTLSRAKSMIIVIGNERTMRASLGKWQLFYLSAEQL